jgi:hypothetical protein
MHLKISVVCCVAKWFDMRAARASHVYEEASANIAEVKRLYSGIFSVLSVRLYF